MMSTFPTVWTNDCMVRLNDGTIFVMNGRNIDWSYTTYHFDPTSKVSNRQEPSPYLELSRNFLHHEIIGQRAHF